MRAFLVVAAAALLGSACYRSAEPVRRTNAVSGDRWAEARDAYLTDGTTAVVGRDARSGELVIIEPYELRGRPVAVVNEDAEGHRTMVQLLDRSGWRDYHREGSGGDRR